MCGEAAVCGTTGRPGQALAGGYEGAARRAGAAGAAAIFDRRFRRSRNALRAESLRPAGGGGDRICPESRRGRRRPELDGCLGQRKNIPY